MKLIYRLLLGSAVLFGAVVHAEPRLLPPVVNSSTYPAAKSDKPSRQQSVYETLGRLEQLQAEVQALRGETEEQAFTILQLKSRIKDIYADFDQRLEQLEKGLTAHPPPVAGVTVPPAPEQQVMAPVQPPEAAFANEKLQYQKAYETLRNGHYNQAIQLLTQLLHDFPKGQYADNAQYWLGEAYKVNNNQAAAKQAFSQVISAYPESPKVADAMLKLGYLELENNNRAKARDLLTGVTVRFPGSTAAHLAAKKLSQLQ